MSERILVVDHGNESRERARNLGLRTIEDVEAAAQRGGVIYAPWHHHPRLAALAARAETAGRPVFRNRPPAGAAERPRRVLFVGNSYTYANDMPGWVTRLAESSALPPQLETSSETAGGATLADLVLGRSRAHLSAS